MSISVQVGIKPEHEEDAARLYAKAFERKYVKILGPQEEIAELFANEINGDMGISAISADNELLGVAGFQLGGKKLVGIDWRDYTKQYGLIKGLIKLIVFESLFYRKPDEDKQLLMDGIVVKEGNRGKGIGKELFKKLEAFSIENNLTSLKLDVIDENPKAKKLYERIGFEPKKYQKVPKMIQVWIGVSGVTTMVKKI